MQQGIIKNADYLLIQVHHLEVENQLQAAVTLRDNISDYLSSLVGQNESNIIIPSDGFDLAISQNTESPELNSQRKDLMAVQLGLEAQEKNASVI